MPRPIFALLAALQSTLAELRDALNPLQALSAGFKASGGDQTFPLKGRRGPGKERAASRKSVPATTPVKAPAPTAPTKPARKPARRAKGTKARLALQGKYISVLRKLSKADQAEVKKVRAEQGADSAIKVAATKAG
jgi:hypothetical protein